MNGLATSIDTADNALSPIDACLDPDHLRQHLAEALGRPVAALRITEVRRSSSRRRNPHPLHLAFEAQLADDSWQAFNGRLCRDAGGAQALLAEAAQALGGVQGLLLPALQLVLWPWPHDPVLPQLPALLDLDQTRRFTGRPARAVQVLRYSCGQRATLRYQVDDSDADNSGTWLYAKTFGDDRAEAIHQRFVHFWQQAQTDADAPTVAQPLGHDVATRTLWQAAACGRPLPMMLAAAPAPWLPGQVAQAWATVHNAPLALAGPQPRDRTHWLTEVGRRQRKVARALPDLTPTVDRLAATLQAASAALPEPAHALIHGDCHPDQLWLDGRRVVLFDFDEFKLGDPMEDLAGFTAKLAPEGTPAAFGRRMLAAYAEAAPAHFNPARLQWHLAVQQLLQASRAFIFQRPGWPAEMAQRLARAQASADACLQGTTP